ncbi:MAG: glycosyltransferase [Bacteroidetes bacterium]|nr:glycosyltransferase [Bacteroidota bacterium]
MNILILTKTKKKILKPTHKTVSDYIKNEDFFYGWNEGFKADGHQTFLNWEESFFLPVSLKIKFLLLYRILHFSMSLTRLSCLDRYLFSRKIAKFCKLNKINAVFTEINISIAPKIIKDLVPDVVITQWYGIFPEMSNKETLKILSQYDLIWGPVEFDHTKVFFEGIENLKYIGCAVDDNMFYYDFDPVYAYDVVFVGGIGKGHSNRIETLEAIANNISSFAFYGYGEENIPKGYKLKEKFKGWVNTDEMRKLFSSSRIAINLTLDGYDRIKKGFNARLFEIAACGGALQMVKSDEKINEFYTVDEEVITFNNNDDLVTKINIYLSQKEASDKIAKSAMIKTSKYTYFEKAKLATEIMKNYHSSTNN